MTDSVFVSLAKKLGNFDGVMQIVPSVGLHEMLMDAGASPATLTYHGGKLIDNGRAKFYNVYLGAMDFNTSDFDGFTKAIVENGYYISPDGNDKTSGKFLGSAQVAWPFSGTTVDDTQIRQWVDQKVQAGVFPAQDGYTMYALIMPSGSTVTMQGSSSCSVFCGYHTATDKGNYYQVICDAACIGCHGSFTAEQGRMMIQSHEYGEWRSDPDGTGWYNDQSGMENADECAWIMVPWGPQGTSWAVQPLAVNGPSGTTCIEGAYQPTSSPPPSLHVSVSVDAPSKPATQSFSFVATIVPAVMGASYSWDFGDGGRSTVANPTHAYAVAGTYTITLTVSTSSQGSGSGSVMVVVTPPPTTKYTASIDASPTSGNPGTTVSFKAVVTPTPASATYLWDFGNGVPDTKSVTTHIYANAGTFTVVLKVNADSQLLTATKDITIAKVSPPPPQHCRDDVDVSMNVLISQVQTDTDLPKWWQDYLAQTILPWVKDYLDSRLTG